MVQNCYKNLWRNVNPLYLHNHHKTTCIIDDSLSNYNRLHSLQINKNHKRQTINKLLPPIKQNGTNSFNDDIDIQK